MITYRLSSRNGDSKPDGLDLSVPANRELLFRRILKRCKYKIGRKIVINGTKHSGTIKNVIKDFKEVQWNQGHPCFIVVLLDDGREVVCSRNQVVKR